jgi:hypothetical protein
MKILKLEKMKSQKSPMFVKDAENLDRKLKKEKDLLRQFEEAHPGKVAEVLERVKRLNTTYNKGKNQSPRI